MPVALNVAALGVAAIYYLWRDGYHFGLIRQRLLHERVAYLLWTTANHAACSQPEQKTAPGRASARPVSFSSGPLTAVRNRRTLVFCIRFSRCHLVQ